MAFLAIPLVIDTSISFNYNFTMLPNSLQNTIVFAKLNPRSSKSKEHSLIAPSMIFVIK